MRIEPHNHEHHDDHHEEKGDHNSLVIHHGEIDAHTLEPKPGGIDLKENESVPTTDANDDNKDDPEVSGGDDDGDDDGYDEGSDFDKTDYDDDEYDKLMGDGFEDEEPY